MGHFSDGLTGVPRQLSATNGNGSQGCGNVLVYIDDLLAVPRPKNRKLAYLIIV
jgi:hypothetical protein